jgi:hypothetical protein
MARATNSVAKYCYPGTKLGQKDCELLVHMHDLHRLEGWGASSEMGFSCWPRSHVSRPHAAASTVVRHWCLSSLCQKSSLQRCRASS